VALAVLGAAVLVLKSGYHGPFEDVLNAYAGNVAVSFALYFAAINATSSYGRPRLIAAALTLLAVELFEVTNGFGVTRIPQLDLTRVSMGADPGVGPGDAQAEATTTGVGRST